MPIKDICIYDYLTLLELDCVQKGIYMVKKICEGKLYGINIITLAVLESDTLKTVREFKVEMSDTITWRRIANKFLKYIRLRII